MCTETLWQHNHQFFLSVLLFAWNWLKPMLTISCYQALQFYSDITASKLIRCYIHYIIIILCLALNSSAMQLRYLTFLLHYFVQLYQLQNAKCLRAFRVHSVSDSSQTRTALESIDQPKVTNKTLKFLLWNPILTKYLYGLCLITNASVFLISYEKIFENANEKAKTCILTIFLLKGI